MLLLLRLVLAASLVSMLASPCYAQNKMACELVSKADAETILGATLQPPKPYAPFRSLLEDRDFAKGKLGEGCEFTSYAPDQPRAKTVAVNIEVRYSAAPNPRAVEEARKQVDERTRESPTDISGFGDAAFWIGPANFPSLFVFRAGTMRLMIGPSEIGLDKEKALAVKALGGTGGAAGNAAPIYGAARTLAKPVLGDPAAKPSQIDQLKRELSAKADAGDAKAQLALANLYQFGTLAADGSAKPDYTGAAYWYQEAADRGQPEAAYKLALLYRSGLGLAVNPSAARDLFRKAAEAGYVPAMAQLSFAYAEAKTAVSQERATYWAMNSAQAGDPQGWFILGFEYNQGWLGGDRSYAYRNAMDAYRKAAAGGVCLAMKSIGEMYLNGEGAPQNAALAREWSAKAELCHNKALDSLWDKTATLRAMADGGRVPAPGEAVPELRRPGPAGEGQLSRHDRFFAGLAAAFAIVLAIDLLHPSSGQAGGHGRSDFAGPSNDLPEKSGFDLWRDAQRTACAWTLTVPCPY